VVTVNTGKGAATWTGPQISEHHQWIECCTGAYSHKTPCNIIIPNVHTLLHTVVLLTVLNFMQDCRMLNGAWEKNY